VESEKELKLDQQQDSNEEEHRKALLWLLQFTGAGSGSGIR